ncbi:MAG TPA: CoA transferase, partial [Candidatus Acidoferrales bacterium]|nr:CoA transferase [Candidatus Acidoferrales bacterium]
NGHAEYRGRSALSRAYRCHDGEWVFISLANESQWRALRSIAPSVPHLAWEAAAGESNDGRLAAALSEEFARRDHADALAALASAGVPASRVNHFRDLFDDAQVRANDLIAELTHSDWGRVRQTGMLMQFHGATGTIERAAPKLGEHTDEVLREFLGYPPEKIAALRSARIIK